MLYEVLVPIIITTSITNCEWVEIPQATISADKDVLSKKTDITTYTLTTSSTTVQTPIFVKPSLVVDQKSTSLKNGTTNKTDTYDVDVTSNQTDSISLTSGVNQAPNATGSTTSSINDDEAEVEEVDNEYLTEDSVSEDSNHKDEGEYGYSYVSFIPYLSQIQSTLMKNTHKNERSKVNVLKNLRDHLLIQIEDRMTTLWKPKTESRGAREYKDDSHVDFPSNEGALMTIGFLTFAVFLIKLVLQLIQTLSNKMDYDDGTATTYIGRKRRATAEQDAIKILNYIEQFQFK